MVLQALKANLSKHVRRVDEAKDAAGAKSLKKKEQRLNNWKAEAAKQIAKYNTQTGIIVSGRGATWGGVGRARAVLVGHSRGACWRKGSAVVFAGALAAHAPKRPACPCLLQRLCPPPHPTPAAYGVHDCHVQGHEPPVRRRGPRSAPAL